MNTTALIPCALLLLSVPTAFAQETPKAPAQTPPPVRAVEPQPSAEQEPPKAPAQKPPPRTEHALPVPTRTKELPFLLVKPKPRPGGPVTYGGALADIVHADKPLHELNPFAPAEYGDGTQNLVRDPITGKPQGIALFSLHF